MIFKFKFYIIIIFTSNKSESLKRHDMISSISKCMQNVINLLTAFSFTLISNNYITFLFRHYFGIILNLYGHSNFNLCTLLIFPRFFSTKLFEFSKNEKLIKTFKFYNSLWILLVISNCKV